MTTAYYTAGIVASIIAILRFGIAPVIRATQARMREHRRLVDDVAALTNCVAGLTWTIDALNARLVTLEGKDAA